MRVSGDRSDPGYETPMARYARVFLDHQEIRHVVTADDAEGLVVVEVTDDGGRPVLDRSKKQILRKEMRGHVQIILPSMGERCS